MRFRACVLILVCSVPSLARAQRIDLRETGEHRSTAGEAFTVGRERALVDAQRRLWNAAAQKLGTRPDIRALRLKPGVLEAYTTALVDVEELPTGTPRTTSPVHQVSVRALMDSGPLVQRMAALHKDQDATLDLMIASTELQRLQDPMAFSVKVLTAKATAALARTEFATIGGRTPSADGRQSARRYVDAALARQPESPDAQFVLGDLLIDAQQPVAAEAAYRRGLAGRSDSTEGRRKLAEALRLQSKLEEAEAELLEVLRVEPGSARAHNDRALVLRGRRQVPEAVAEYREALRLDPDLIDAHNNLAIVLAGQGNLSEAEAGFRQILRLDPDSAQAYFNLATVLADLDKDIEAAAALREVIRIYPDHYNARYNLGELFRLEGKFDDAARQFGEFLRLAPADTATNRRNIERAKGFVAKFTNQ
jgi:tetratricopeptide (TPR) repeat protein